MRNIKITVCAVMVILILIVSGCEKENKVKTDRELKTIQGVDASEQVSDIAEYAAKLEATELEKQELVEAMQNLEVENLTLMNEIDELKEKNQTLNELSEDYNDVSNTYVIGYNGQKYPKPIGLKTYNGTQEVHVYPHDESPIIDFFYEGEIVETLEYVWIHDWNDEVADKGTWFAMMNTWGQFGFVREEGISDYISEYKDNYLKFQDVEETIEGCTLGDRIEKLIGSLDQDYLPLNENGKFYGFLDIEAETERGDESYNPFGKAGEMIVFTDESKHINGIRVSSMGYKLDSGYGVGSLATKVRAFYDDKYETYIREQDPDFQPSPNSPFTMDYLIGETAVLTFYIDTDDLTEESRIVQYTLNSAPVYK